MATDVKTIAEQSKRFWSNLPARKRVILVAAVLGTLLLVGLAVTHTTPENYTMLYAGLSAEDAGEIASELRTQKVPYKLDNGGTSISVPEARVPELRISLAQKGIPKGGGVGFEVFDKQSFGATSFVEQMNYRRALQGELQRSIGSLDAVEAARVHLAMPERSLYRNEDQPPTASVLLKLRRGRTLSAPEVRGIVHLVSSSIPGLSPERVTVVDESGRVLSSGDEGGDGGTRQHELEAALARRVETMLTPMVGEGHLEVSVTAELDQSQTERTEEAYDKDSLALRSESRTLEGSEAGVAGAGAGGIAGARGNLPGAPAPTTGTPGTGTQGLTRLSETKNYEVSKVVSRTIGPREKVKRLHVAVLVDGVAKGEGKARTVVPREAKELAQIESLAREAAGIENERGDKIEVHSVPFAAASAFADEADVAAKSAWPVSKPIALGAAAGALALLILVAFLLLRRGRKKSANVALVAGLPVRVGELEAQLPGAAGANGALELPAGARAPRERVIEAARTDAARAARVLSAWLSEPVPSEPGGSK